MKRIMTILTLAALFVFACDDVADPDTLAPDFEVWLVDQSNSPGVTYGGFIHIYEDDALLGAQASQAKPAVTIDIAQATAAMCMASTGANPVRPHMIFFNSTRTHAVLSFVASGHVVIYDTRTRAPVACVRSSPGAGGARQAHAAFPAPDDSYILVANQNGKLLERIDASFATNTFAFNPSATIDLVACTTPAGLPCQSAELRPDNAPICPIIDASGNLAFVTLRGGGLFIVNPKTNPMRIVAEYDRTAVHGNGCGGVQTGQSMYLNSGGGTMANMHQFDVYKFGMADLAGSPSSARAVNAPAPKLVFEDGGDRDAHGMTLTGGGRYVWMADRATNVIEVFDANSDARLPTLRVDGALSSDPTPDLLDVSPDGRFVFASLRGPTPLSGDPHVSTGSTPGLMVIDVTDDGRRGSVKSIVRVTNMDGAVERADPHGIRVRLK